MSLFLSLAWTAISLRVDYFDSFDIFLNARELAGIHDGPWFWKKPIFMPMLLAPIFWLSGAGNEVFSVSLSRLLCVFFWAGLAGSLYRHLRLSFNRNLALFGTCLLALNPLVIHYAPFVREDIPAAFFLSASFYFYLRSRNSPAGWYTAAGCLSMSCAMITRFNLIPIPFAVIIFCEALDYLPKKYPRAVENPWDRIYRIFYFLFLPALLFVLFSSALYAFRGEVSFAQGPQKLFKDLLAYYSVFSSDQGTWWENFAFLQRSYTWPVIGLALLGMYSCLKQKISDSALYMSWFLTFFLLHTLIIQHKEARYLFPCFVPLYYFCVQGLESLHLFLSRRFERISSQVISMILGGLVVLLPSVLAVSEVGKFRDPFYRIPFMEHTSLTASSLMNPGGKIIWFGPKYPLFPEKHHFHPEDEFTYIYHFYNHTVRFYTGRRIFAYAYNPKDPQNVVIPLGGKFGFFVPGIGEIVEDGDVLIVNLEKEDYRENNLPLTLLPLVVERARTVNLPYVQREGEGHVFGMPGGEMSLRVEDKGEESSLTFQGFPEGVFEIYLVRGSHKSSVGFAVLQKGKNLIQCQKLNAASGDRLMFLGFDQIKLLGHPSIPGRRTGIDL